MKRRRSGGVERPAPRAPFDVIALVASAGGHAAIAKVVAGLPKDFPVPLVVMQHLPESAKRPLTDTPRNAFKRDWARPSSILTPGSILVAPPHSFLEILPDGTCAISRAARGTLDNPIDRLLQSLARNFAHRAIAVVLSGMMKDGAAGARELRAAGGAVVAQSGAEYGSMPQAVIQAGGADVSLPVGEIAPFLVALTAGAPLPRPPSELDAVHALFSGNGRARSALRAINWAATPLGPVTGWPAALTIAVRNVMSAIFPSCIFWGPEFVQIYNEAFLPILGAKPSSAGKPARLTWPELWPALGPRLTAVLQTGAAIFAEDQLHEMERSGYAEELYLTHSYSALLDDRGTVCGVLNTATETTDRVRASRRLKILATLAEAKHNETPLLVAERAAAVLTEAPLDVPFALLYLLDRRCRRANLVAAVGLEPGTPAAPHLWMAGDQSAVWPIADIVRSGTPKTVNDLASRLPRVHAGPWPESPSSAMLLPLRSGGDSPVAGVIVIGLSPRLRADPIYEEFVRLIAEHINAAIGEAESQLRDRARVAQLAELDQAKVEFFSNVSHEFRTPLTLLLGPMEELLARRASLPHDLRAPVDSAVQNGRRLLSLINTLLDFSQTESQRQKARFEPTDLAALTTGITGAFRPAIEGAGLRFEVNVPQGLPTVQVDPQMWERIVANLLSNALKFTFEGTITVELVARTLHVEMVIRDTGTGISEDEIPNLFKRFHRIRGTRARTAEGSGIGLWMVDHLVKRLGAQLRVRSTKGVGTAFTIWVPYKSARAGEVVGVPDEVHTAELATQVASAASRWVADAERGPGGVVDDVLGPGPLPASSTDGARVLVVDDNADMRDHLSRLLSPHWRVEVAADGEDALAKMRALHPNIVLADVMMPNLDGFGLLRAVRADEALKSIPVIILTARAGEGAAIEGFLAGADDYIAKPFSGRELIARVRGQLELGRVRRRTAELNDFLVRFSDTVRTLVEPHAVARAGLRMLADHLSADRAHWAEVDWTTREYVVEDAVQRDLGTPLPLGRFALDASQPPAQISVPVMADGHERAVLGVGHEGARDWTPEDVALVEGVAGRLWAEVERARAEAAVRASREELATEAEALKRLHDASTRLWRSVDLRAGLEAILEATVTLLGADMGNVQLLNPMTRKLEIVAHRGFDATFLRFFREVSTDDDSACGRSLRSGQRTVIEDVTTDSDYAPLLGMAADAGYRAVQSTPLLGHTGEPLGMLSTHFGQPHRPSEHDLRRLDLYARQAVDFIERHRIEHPSRPTKLIDERTVPPT